MAMILNNDLSIVRNQLFLFPYLLKNSVDLKIFLTELNKVHHKHTTILAS